MNTKLILGDCLDKMNDIDSGSVDLILTDPPYGTVKNASFFRNNPNTSWDIKINTFELFKQFERILRKNGKLVLFAQQPYTTELIHNSLNNLPLCYSMVWDKMNFANCFIAKKACVKYTEDILLFSKKSDPNDGNESRDYFANERLKSSLSLTQINKIVFGDTSGKDGMAGNILSSMKKGWVFPTKERYIALQKIGLCLEPYEKLETINDKLKEKYSSTFNLWEGKKSKSNIFKYKNDYDSLHPTQKPILLLEDLIKTFSNKNDLVLDATMGSGSTGVACVNIDRNFIGIEQDIKYFEIATKRINESKKSILNFTK